MLLLCMLEMAFFFLFFFFLYRRVYSIVAYVEQNMKLCFQENRIWKLAYSRGSVRTTIHYSNDKFN